MATWTVTPTWKKSIRDVQWWVKDGNEICHTTTWRWGEFTIEVPDDQEPDLDPDGDFDIMDCGYTLLDFSTDDGVDEDIDMDECESEVEEEVQAFLDEGNSIYDLEELGWSVERSEMWIDCPVEIAKNGETAA